MLLPLWWGERLYGAVHQVPGVCHVATVFYHLCHVPFFPTRTYLVVDAPGVATGAVAAGLAKRVRLMLAVMGERTGADDVFVGVRLKLSWLSIAVTAGRGVLVAVGAFGVNAIMALVLVSLQSGFVGVGPFLFCVVLAAGCGVLYRLTRTATRAGEARRADLLARLGLPEYPEAGEYGEPVWDDPVE